MFTMDRQVDRRILLEAESLMADGWTVTIVAMCSKENERHDPDYVVRLQTGGSGSVSGDSFILSGARLLLKLFPQNGMIVRYSKAIVWKYIRKPESFYTRLFSQEIKKYKADVYVAHDLPMMPVAVAAADYHGGKLVYDSHELFVEQELSRFEKQMWMNIEKTHMPSFDIVITVNGSIARELEQRYSLSRVEVVHNCELLPERKLVKQQKLFHDRFSLVDDAVIMLFQGGLSAGRNIETLICAMEHISLPGLHLVILGDGAAGASLQRLCRRIGGERQVHFHPAVPQRELLQYTASADVGIIPYQSTCLNNYYCTPNKLFEFIAAGIPIIATDLPEIRTFVLNNGLGVVGDTAEAAQVACLVEQFFSDTEKLEGFRRSVEKAGKTINWQCEGEIIKKLYRNLSNFTQ